MLRRLATALAVLVPVASAGAQTVTRDTTAAPPAARTNRFCAGEPIADIVVVAQPPFTERLPERLEWVRTAVRRLHMNTRDQVVLNYLLLKAGDRCTEEARAESERILRAQPFLVDARILVYPEDSGMVRLEVETRDEFSLIFAPNLATNSPVLKGLRIGERNLAGAAVDASLLWRHSPAYPDVFGARLISYQFAGLRNELRMLAVRNQYGNEYSAELVKPYYTDLQRLAWRAVFGGTTTQAQMIRPEADPNALVVDRRYSSIGAITRVGPPRQLRLVGLSLSQEHHRTGSVPVMLTDTGIVADTMGPVPGEFRRQDVTRFNALLGMRRFRFERVVGFDALAGAQDVRIGFQVGVLAGRSLPMLGGRDVDRFFSGDIFAGYGSQKSYVALQSIAEGRRNIRETLWDGILTSGRLAWYLRPAQKQLTLAEIEWSTGSRVRVPFQLSFADPEGGMLGYGRTQIPGGRRLIIRTEQRLIRPSVRNLGDAGISVFADVGRMWRGDSPYGMTTPWRASTGISLLAAVPPRSRRLWRLDLAMPIGSDPNAGFAVRFSSADRSRSFWNDPRDLRGARERTAPASLFSWP